MRLIGILIVGSMVLLHAQAQTPPYVKNPYTTNNPAGMTNVTKAIIFSAPGVDGPYVRTNDSRTVSLSGQFNMLGPVSYFSSTMHAATIEVDVVNADQLTVTNTAIAANFQLAKPQWTDIPLVYGYSILGPNAPSLTVTTNNGPIQQLAMDNGDIVYASTRFPHNLAITNAAFPNFYWQPHIHWTPIGTLDATHSNVTWTIEWEMATNYGPWNIRGTNTVTTGVTNNETLRTTAMGFITNTVPPGHDTGLRIRLRRPASGAQNYSNAHDILFDGIEVRVPVGNEVILGHPEP